MSRLRVAIVTESFPPSVNGVAGTVARVAEHLRRRGHEVVVVAPGPGQDGHDGVPVVRVPSLPLPLCPELPVGLPVPRLRETLEAFRPDVVHLASPAVLGHAGGRIARDLGVPVLAVHQTDLPGFATRYRLRPLARPLWGWVRRTHALADRTLAATPTVARDLRLAGVRDVHVWGRGVDAERFTPRLRTRPSAPAVLRVGYVGRLAPEKAVERLAPLVDLPGTELVVVGDGVARRALERRLPGATFTGVLRGTELARAFADLDLFVHTGTHETFCQTVQEAMASGVVVVVPDAGGPRDLVTDGVTGRWWDATDPSSLRRVVAELLDDERQRRRLAAAGAATVAGRSWERLGDELLDHLRAVALRDRSRAAA
ncbi:MAG: glycosyltransferase family 4 protein [Actinomycetes bacterium]